ncbi:MauE/DoxX family redox-associated membrane protein [Microbispora corallina]|uniref:MauE/DoxX family redox-associated membrane protein n=1 Tax=Microbispora corallina TaxID=83302 RepID=UPI0031E12808
MGYLALSLRIALSLVFAAAVAGKARHPSAFAAAVREIGRVPGTRLSSAAAALIAAAEAATALALPSGGTAPYGLAAAGALLAAFTPALALAVRRGTRRGCACFGGARSPVGPWHLVRNGVLLLAVGVAAAVAGAAAPRDAGEVAACGLAGAAAAALLVGGERLLAVLAGLTVAGESVSPASARLPVTATAGRRGSARHGRGGARSPAGTPGR